MYADSSRMEPDDPPVAHACFILEAGRGLTMPVEIADYPAWHYLSHCVLRAPDNLHNHTRRIRHCQKTSLNRFMAGAVHDLFVILGSKGENLRDRLFESSKHLMSTEQSNYFNQWLTNKTQPEILHLHFNGALLSATGGQFTSRGLVRKRRVLSNGYASIELEVQDRIARGQLNIALELLEDSLLDGEFSPELEKVHSQINWHEQDLAEIQTLLNKLGPAKGENSRKVSG